MGIDIIKSPEYKIRKIREIKNYSQDYIAQSLGLSVRAYSKIETGETQLTIKRLNEISGILEVTPMEILGFDEKKIFNRIQPTDFSNELQQVGEKPIEYYDKKIKQLENELNFLRLSFQKTARTTL